MQYMFFDTAVNGIYTLTVLQRELKHFLPLISGDDLPDDVAPFIFEIDNEKLAQLLLVETMSLSKIIIIETNETINSIQQYYSQFTIQNLKGKPFYFRFWSADVFTKFIRTCDKQQISTLFLPTAFFITGIEVKDEAIIFTQQNGLIKESKISVENIYSQWNEEEKDVSVEAQPETVHEANKPRRRFIY